MSINIYELAPELQELVHIKQIEAGNDGTFTGQLYSGRADKNFKWENTVEGYKFWEDINDRKDVRDHICYPKAKDTIINDYSIF